MSEKIVAVADCCANCGTKEIDDIKLMDCDGGCDLAKYCGDECQKDHQEKHEAICKQRASELRDEILFRQPESSCFGDCPICFLPLPLDVSKSAMYWCCGKRLCKGCVYASFIRDEEQRLKHRCPFCRKHLPETDGEGTKMLMNRAATNDPLVLRHLGVTKRNERAFGGAFKYLTRAAELGDAEAHYYLSVLYRKGEGVEKDEEREIYHLEEAAIAGHPEARYALGVDEWRHSRLDRAVKHWIIASNLGHEDSVQLLKIGYKEGHISKDDLAAALRSHQAAVDATKSPQREAAEQIKSSRN